MAPAPGIRDGVSDMDFAARNLGSEGRSRKRKHSSCGQLAEELLEGAVVESATPVSHKALPPPPKGLTKDENGNEPITIALFYQYVEPPWTPKEHKAAIAFLYRLGKDTNVTGRGRCAQEGVNCTLTGPARGIRAFCQGLRDWNPIFEETDFKFTDGLEHGKRFKALTIQKKGELVAYGLEGARAPVLKTTTAVHLEAPEYHKMMAEPNTVIVDVRNYYEAEIGHFQPPEGGAQLIIPKVRNSHEFPKWLNQPETKELLNGKKVMMYCTGGIRCERFSALLDEVKKKPEEEFSTKGIFQVRGGIERYIKTFPEGGFWRGRNFVFDRRMEQVPEKKSEEELNREISSLCCVCKSPCGVYRGGFKCAQVECKVPIIVCGECKNADRGHMRCPLCEEAFSLRESDAPQLRNSINSTWFRNELRQQVSAKRAKHANKDPSKRIFVGGLPLAIDARNIREALGGGVELVYWIPDQETGFWYGSTFVQMRSLEAAKRVVEEAASSGIKLGNRRLRVNFAPPREDEEWPPADHKVLERPPIPVS